MTLRLNFGSTHESTSLSSAICHSKQSKLSRFQRSYPDMCIFLVFGCHASVVSVAHAGNVVATANQISQEEFLVLDEVYRARLQAIRSEELSLLKEKDQLENQKVTPQGHPVTVRLWQQVMVMMLKPCKL